MNKKNDINNTTTHKFGKSMATVALATTITMSPFNKSEAETKVDDKHIYLTEQTISRPQKYTANVSKPRKIWDMYRLAVDNNTQLNLIPESEKEKCVEFFKNNQEFDQLCKKAYENVKKQQETSLFHAVEYRYEQTYNSNFRIDILTALKNNKKAAKELNKINYTDYSDKMSKEELASQIWDMYVVVNSDRNPQLMSWEMDSILLTSKAPKSYKNFFDKYPSTYYQCVIAEQEAAVADVIDNISIDDVNRILQDKKQETLTDRITSTVNDYKNVGLPVRVPTKPVENYIISSNEQQR